MVWGWRPPTSALIRATQGRVCSPCESLIQVHIWGRTLLNCKAMSMSLPHPSSPLLNATPDTFGLCWALISLSLPLPLLPAHHSHGAEFALFCVFSHRRKGAEITCPISLRKRTRIRTRRLTFLSSCPCWRT